MKRLAITGILSGLVLLFFGLNQPVHALACSVNNPDACRTCEEVRKAYSGQDFNVRAIRGRAVWTPVYTAYFKNCFDLAARYVSFGADPRIGGMEGDMLATVISWDRFDVPERSKWVKILVDAGARLDSPPISGRTTRDRLMQEYGPRDDIMQLIQYAEQLSAGQ